ncbi:hypothetical protein SAMN05444743_110115 [Pseudomonas sp. PDC86]|nr:hypothetical protein [Pseudomonas extremaustralis]SDZ18501.1 hypothetical protein SAMN05444743_110115 [Pseudomonas sp. PDC86]
MRARTAARTLRVFSMKLRSMARFEGLKTCQK